MMIPLQIFVSKIFTDWESGLLARGEVHYKLGNLIALYEIDDILACIPDPEFYTEFRDNLLSFRDADPSAIIWITPGTWSSTAAAKRYQKKLKFRFFHKKLPKIQKWLESNPS